MSEPRPTPITVLVCDDHRILTDSLAMIIRSDDDLELVGEPVADPESGIEVCRTTRPDVVLMDYEFRGRMNGMEATRRIRAASPDTNVIIMTAHEDDAVLVACVEAGACGFLNKTEALDEVIAAVKGAADGDVLIDPVILSKAMHTVAQQREARREADSVLDHLTEREREILQLLAHGLRNDGIAEKLFISPQTVQTHVRNILAKLGVHSKLEAVSFAIRHGAVTV